MWILTLGTAQGRNFMSLCHSVGRFHRLTGVLWAAEQCLHLVLAAPGLRAQGCMELHVWSCSSSTSPFWWNSKIFEPLLFWFGQWSNWVPSVKSSILVLHATQLWKSCWSLGCEWRLGILSISHRKNWQWFASWRASHRASSVALNPHPYLS